MEYIFKNDVRDKFGNIIYRKGESYFANEKSLQAKIDAKDFKKSDFEAPEPAKTPEKGK
ncbi:MAG: hypothetical protein UY48_C0021G0005 [Candidatus Gottesmanbacteria bacterium GW2011_GWB1_49_7]|uniref:Uncharacterized protein n=1 Tax=Candidatus Gottesmanbacteria bacterium GW2011_GWB1_49_7 TaxID=1618448 RepID=A0A0G1VXZ2_9BACT|nr:MAG: hypothetical protein UY48_C0021G0005 [Candidatus Gottesmanbacteria bacterium GW2011_GWB1_49_7]